MTAIGLRERKKAETRDALVSAALRLADERGLEHVTVEDIATAAGVSPRTFFNYFPSKEDAIVGSSPAFTASVVEALCGRPDDEPPLESLRHAVHVSADHLESEPDAWFVRKAPRGALPVARRAAQRAPCRGRARAGGRDRTPHPARPRPRHLSGRRGGLGPGRGAGRARRLGRPGPPGLAPGPVRRGLRAARSRVAPPAGPTHGRASVRDHHGDEPGSVGRPGRVGAAHGARRRGRSEPRRRSSRSRCATSTTSGWCENLTGHITVQQVDDLSS